MIAVRHIKDSPTARPSGVGQELLTPCEVAERLKVTAEQVRSLIRKGHLAAVNVGAGRKRPLYRITPQGLADFLARRFQPGPAAHPGRIERLPPVPDFFPSLR